jgi:hypothetical protein
VFHFQKFGGVFRVDARRWQGARSMRAAGKARERRIPTWYSK